jgi:hypothetical protein
VRLAFYTPGISRPVSVLIAPELLGAIQDRQLLIQKVIVFFASLVSPLEHLGMQAHRPLPSAAEDSVCCAGRHSIGLLTTEFLPRCEER